MFMARMEMICLDTMTRLKTIVIMMEMMARTKQEDYDDDQDDGQEDNDGH